MFLSPRFRFRLLSHTPNEIENELKIFQIPHSINPCLIKYACVKQLVAGGALSACKIPANRRFCHYSPFVHCQTIIFCSSTFFDCHQIRYCSTKRLRNRIASNLSTFHPSLVFFIFDRYPQPSKRITACRTPSTPTLVKHTTAHSERDKETHTQIHNHNQKHQMNLQLSRRGTGEKEWRVKKNRIELVHSIILRMAARTNELPTCRITIQKRYISHGQ